MAGRRAEVAGWGRAGQGGRVLRGAGGCGGGEVREREGGRRRLAGGEAGEDEEDVEEVRGDGREGERKRTRAVAEGVWTGRVAGAAGVLALAPEQRTARLTAPGFDPVPDVDPASLARIAGSD